MQVCLSVIQKALLFIKNSIYSCLSASVALCQTVSHLNMIAIACYLLIRLVPGYIIVSKGTFLWLVITSVAYPAS